MVNDANGPKSDPKNGPKNGSKNDLKDGLKKEIKNIEHAINHYPEYFDRPSAVIQNSSLNRLDKIRLFRQWKYDIQLQEVAEEENMHSSNPDILDEIQSALAFLKADEHVDDTPPTKTGGLS